MITVISEIGLSQDAVKVSRIVKEAEIEINDTTKEDLIACLKNEFGSDVYDAFYQYIEDEFITYGTKLVSVDENDSSQKNTEVDVYKDELEIPLNLFDTNALGKKNEISQLWYAGNFADYLIPYKNSYKTDNVILQNGKEIYIDYTSYRADGGYMDTPLEKMYSMQYDQLYKVSFGSVVFAKAPEQIEMKDNIVSNGTAYRVEWEIPADNGAEILGYQIAIMPRGVEPSENDYILDGSGCGSYEDLGDNYILKYTTTNNYYDVDTNGENVDVYIRAINVMGVSKDSKIEIVEFEEEETTQEETTTEETTQEETTKEETKEETTEPTEKETANRVEKETTLVTQEKETTYENEESTEEATEENESEEENVKDNETQQIEDDKADGMADTGDDVSDKVIVLVMLALLAAIATILVARKNKYE